MSIATVHLADAELPLIGSYEATGDVLYLSSPGDDKSGSAQETPEGHAVRLDPNGQVTHVSAVNARWLLEQHGELVASLRDGRQLRIHADEVIDLLV